MRGSAKQYRLTLRMYHRQGAQQEETQDLKHCLRSHRSTPHWHKAADSEGCGAEEQVVQKVPQIGCGHF